MRIQLKTTFEEIISPDNLLEAWEEFVKGKRSKPGRVSVWIIPDGQLGTAAQRSGTAGISAWSVLCLLYFSDPRPRDIHKASVRDRALHHVIYKKLYPFLIVHLLLIPIPVGWIKVLTKPLRRFRFIANKVSKNGTGTYWVPECDI